MVLVIIILIIVAILCYVFYRSQKYATVPNDSSDGNDKPMHFDILDENGNPVKKQKVKVVVGGCNSDAPVQNLQYFCIKNKGYHVSVWPKDHSQFDNVEFPIAGISHRENIAKYIGEFIGRLEAEPTNTYDPNAIKILAPGGHHVGYVPKYMTAEIRKAATLPCSCYCYIGNNNDTYFSDCYILRK